MNRRLTRIALASALALTATIGFASSAKATYHQNYIREVHETPTADYVELQAYASGENLVSGKHIVSYDGGGGVLTDYTIPGNVPNAANQATILIANAPTVGGVAADFNAGVNLNVDNTGGTVCYTDSSITVGLDCVAFQGAMPITVAPFNPPQWSGSPFQLPGANLNGMSLIRTIARGCTTALDTADDTNTAADFTLGPGSPRNNASPITETACPTPPGTTTTNQAKCKKHKKKKKHASQAKKKKKKCKKKKKKK
jgi:hypothetical protein